MKLLFSEAKSDYDNYLFPYAIWAFPEPGETPAQLFQAGFLPSSQALDRFYLCRHIRVHLKQFSLSSENRRVLRKCGGIRLDLIPRREFQYTKERREFYKNYGDIKFGKGTLSFQRLDALFHSRMTSHVLVFTDEQSGAEVGAVTLFMEAPALVYYYLAFYDLNYYTRNLGIYMMTSAVELFARRGVSHLYLGACYSRNALYKTQFAGAEFFNGVHWSADLRQLKHLIKRDQDTVKQHLLESEEFREKFYQGDFENLLASGSFQLPSPALRND